MPIKKIRTHSEYYYEQSCQGKIAHKTWADARKAQARTSRKYGIELNIYKCKFCKRLHNGKIQNIEEKESQEWMAFLRRN